jgi:hypothetical protein
MAPALTSLALARVGVAEGLAAGRGTLRACLEPPARGAGAAILAPAAGGRLRSVVGRAP